MPVTHTVLLQFKPDVTPEDVKAACDSTLALKDKCIHPATNAPYILSFKGGENNSKEGCTNGLTHAFVAEFATIEDRDHYVNNDAAHHAVVKNVGAIADKIIVVDFTPGAY